MAVKLYNTMTRKKEDFIPINGKNVGLYTCGPTVYNYAHIGNLRSFVFEDLLKRGLKYLGYNVTQVMNLTDIDDKTIRDSIAAAIPLRKYTKKYKDAFFEDLKNLRFDKAEHYPAATDHVPEMIDLIKILIDKGYAYKSGDGSVYFSISKFPNYGRLARIDMKNQRAGARVKTDEYEKDSVADFAVWKSWDKNDGDIFWESPWGRGRPGWHIECSAMSMRYLGKTFDIHTGGVDNMFPHHEDEIAQTEAATGLKFVNYWMHCEYLIVEGQKMSKSLGNFYTLRDLVERGFGHNAIRWVLISTHYRRTLNFTLEACKHAEETLKNFNHFFARLNEIILSNREGDIPKGIHISRRARANLGPYCKATFRKTDRFQYTFAEIIDKYVTKFDHAISDDLNISEALAAVFGLQKEANVLMASGKLGKIGAEQLLNAFKKLDTVLAVFDFCGDKEEMPEEIAKIAEERQQARKNKDFITSDLLRDKLKEMGWSVEDTPSGARVSRCSGK